MPWKFNPFSVTLDQTGSGGGGSSYLDGEVATYNDLPLDGTAAADSAWLVRSASGTWLIGRKPAGIYIRTATAGVSRDADYTYAGIFPDVFSDANFTLYDDGDATKTAQFQLSGITTGTNRTLTVPDASGTIATTADFAAPPTIGNTTPNSGAFTTLTANNGTLTASAPVLDLSQTWNDGSVIFTGLKVDITNTASANKTTVADFLIDGASVFSINRNGIGADGNTWATFTTSFGSAVSQGGVWYFNNKVAFNVGSSLGPNSGAIQLGAGQSMGWSSNTQPIAANADLRLWRDGADILAQHRSTNPQTFRLYNTYTSATNFERLNVRWASNELILDAEAGSAGGTLRGIKIGSATSSLLGFYGVTPVDQPATVADPAGGGTQDAEARTAINAIIDRLQELGLIA